MISVVRCVLAKADAPIVVTELGRVSAVSAVSSKAWLPMDVTLLPKATDHRLAHSANA
jgi:hypothetical protein